MKCAECPSFGPVPDCSIFIGIGVCNRVGGSHYNHIISTTHECFEFSPIKPEVEAKVPILDSVSDPAIGVGSVLHGFCDGFFGSGGGDKRIEGMGRDWIVVRELTEDGKLAFASFNKGEDMLRCLIEWAHLGDKR